MKLLDVHVGLEGHSKIDFDKRVVNKGLLKGGRKVQRVARRLVARKALSQPGQNPGKVTGALQKAIDLVKPKSKVGFWIKVEPTTGKIKQTGKIYYPAILFHGTEHLAPRGNYMTQALDQCRADVRTILAQSLADGLTPR